MMKLAVGELIQGYRISRFLGRGGFSSVFQAEHEETGAKVALKVGSVSGGGRQVTRLMEVTARRTPEGISPDELPAEAVFFEPGGVRIDLFDETEVDGMLRAEAELLEANKSSNLVTLKERIMVGDRLTLVLDFIRGKTLREKIRGLEGIHLNWFLSVVRALIELKDEGTLDYHGDLKPENIIIKPSGKVMLIDPAMRIPGHNVVTTTPHYNPLLHDRDHDLRDPDGHAAVRRRAVGVRRREDRWRDGAFVAVVLLQLLPAADAQPEDTTRSRADHLPLHHGGVLRAPGAQDRSRRVHRSRVGDRTPNHRIICRSWTHLRWT